MVSFRRIALLLALGLPVLPVTQAQSSSSSPNSPEQDSSASVSTSASAAEVRGESSVQARIRARREQRRLAALHAVYAHLYEVNIGTGYQRFILPSPLHRRNQYMWNVDFSRYYSERLGVTIDGRGSYGTAYLTALQGGNTGNNAVFRPAISEYSALIGPTYRFYLHPRYSISGRVLGGFSTGIFSGDTNHLPYTGPNSLGLYADSTVFALSASVVAEYNVSPNLGVRIAPEYFATGYGSSLQNNRVVTAGMVYRWGKQ